MQSLTKFEPLSAKVLLNDGTSIPSIGLGTWKMTDQATLDSAIDSAIEAGYRHFDCAELYENEAQVGEALQKACEKYHVKREELWITSKVPPYSMDYETAKGCIENSVNALNHSTTGGYLDLVLIHWPTTIIGEPGDENRLSTWKALQESKDAGLTKSIGVSNFTSKHLNPFLEQGIIPSVNQIEIHPLNVDTETVELCQAKGIAIICYAPLATFDERLMKNPCILQLGDKYGKEANQIALRWAVDRGFIVIPKSSKREHIRSNINIGDFQLLPEEISKINEMNIQLQQLRIRYSKIRVMVFISRLIGIRKMKLDES